MEAEKMSLTLQEFCDMDQLYALLDNWSKSCGMATMLVDAEGFPVSEDFGMTEFCKMVQSCEKGIACCRNTWITECGERYECPFGFQDFSIPIVLPDGQVLGKVLAGQALSDTQKDEYILQKTAGITIVAMTANAFEEDKANAFRAGMNRHIAKPIKVDELMPALSELLKEQTQAL